MTPEARLGFVLFFFACWCFMGLIAWAIAAVTARGRGALPALPVALAGACAAGVALPLVGLDDFAGFLLSLVASFIAGGVASVAGIRIAQRLWPVAASAERDPRRGAREAEGEGSHFTPRT
jgi:hypothetical protein